MTDHSKRTLEENLREEIERSEQRTRMLVEALPLALIIVDGHGSIYCINRQAATLGGWLPDKVVGKKLDHLLKTVPIEFPLSMDFENVPFESQLNTSDERIVYVETGITALNPDDDVWLVSLKDISERRKVETFKRNMVQMISHDLRSPLASLSVFLQLVLDEKLGAVPDAVKDHSLVAKSSCLRLLNLVEGLLDLEMFSSSSLEVKPSLQLTGTIIDAAINSVIDLCQAKGVEIEVEGREIEVFCDENRTVQVLVNLLSNAIKFTKSNSSIKIIARSIDNTVEFSVNDSGPGIQDEERELVFERFFQGEDNEERSGFGLGLAICKEIVDAHNGSIGVRKNGEQGASFWFRL